MIAAFSAWQLAIAQQSEDGDLLGNYQDGYKLNWQLEQPIIERGTVSTLTVRKGTADYCAGFSIEFGANSRSIRSDLSSVLNLAASSCFFQASCGFKVGRINNP